MNPNPKRPPKPLKGGDGPGAQERPEDRTAAVIAASPRPADVLNIPEIRAAARRWRIAHDRAHEALFDLAAAGEDLADALAEPFGTVADGD